MCLSLVFSALLFLFQQDQTLLLTTNTVIWHQQNDNLTLSLIYKLRNWNWEESSLVLKLFILDCYCCMLRLLITNSQNKILNQWGDAKNSTSQISKAENYDHLNLEKIVLILVSSVVNQNWTIPDWNGPQGSYNLQLGIQKTQLSML